ncbi:MAG: ABC transporter ATP-binding protein [Hyphomicrobiales bacterium]|nr:ABC transporter ATP-binding protein [Hyphomicrobiales bacterium]
MTQSDKSSNFTLGEEWGKSNTFGVSIASDIKVEDVHICFGDIRVLSDISLNINPGEVLSLLGPSGSGKTTLLRIIAGLELSDSGTVSIDGKIMSGSNAFVAPEKRGIGLVFQDYALFPHLNVLENVKFGLGHLPGDEAIEQARRTLSRVGLQDYEKSYPHQLSGGEQQRVALSRALAPRPGILLMDEPFSGLDSRLRDTIREQTIELLRDTRSTVIIVTHDPEEALRVSDRIALMQDGRIVQEGSCDDLYYHPNSRFAAEFFTELNTFGAVVKNGKLETPFGSIDAKEIDEGKKAVICVRLSDIDIKPSGTGKQTSGKLPELLGQVVKRRFMGIVELLEIYIQGYEKPIKARIKAGILPAELNIVSVSALKSNIIAFEDK